MLKRYRIIRGKRPAGYAPPEGIRQDARKHTRHILRPSEESVKLYLADPDDAHWERFSKEYASMLEARFAADRQPFDELAALCKREDVYLGCSCPTQKNPDPDRCHTALALVFMKQKYRRLKTDDRVA